MLSIKVFTAKENELIGSRVGSESGVGTGTRGLRVQTEALALGNVALAGVLGEGLLNVLLAIITILFASPRLFLHLKLAHRLQGRVVLNRPSQRSSFHPGPVYRFSLYMYLCSFYCLTAMMMRSRMMGRWKPKRKAQKYLYEAGLVNGIGLDSIPWKRPSA